MLRLTTRIVSETAKPKSVYNGGDIPRKRLPKKCFVGGYFRRSEWLAYAKFFFGNSEIKPGRHSPAQV
jgi:hypothetical protein